MEEVRGNQAHEIDEGQRGRPAPAIRDQSAAAEGKPIDGKGNPGDGRVSATMVCSDRSEQRLNDAPMLGQVGSLRQAGFPVPAGL